MSTTTTNLGLTAPQTSDGINSTITALGTDMSTLDSEFAQHGTTVNRPATGNYIGRRYYDVSIEQPVFWNGSAWVNILGHTPAASATAAPTSGSWVVGDVVYNSAPVASGSMGWVCITAGSPGVWKTFGTIGA